MPRQGRFYPELTLGAGALSQGRRAELALFLRELVRHRGFPIHLASLWNALYFNYDLDHGGFHAEGIEQKRIPTRTAMSRDWSLPVGGFVRVHTEMQCGDLLAEVIYKEGAHPDVSADWVEPSLSGAPARELTDIDGQRVAILRERFVLDLNAFGPNGNAITPKQYERLCRKAHWLDEQGHLVIEAAYAPENADLDDIDYYADYLLREHREGLLAFCFTDELTDAELREALLRSFDAVRDIALATPDLCSWRDKYFFAAKEYAWRLGFDGPLGGGDLRTLFTGLTQFPAGDSRSYSALGPRLVEIIGRDGVDSLDRLLVRGSEYATAVCHANLYVAETAAREQPDGVLKTGVHLRLDDEWQAGGIWRAERVRDPDHYSLATVPLTLPLALGFAEAGTLPDITEAIAAEDQAIASSQTGFRVVLTLRDRALSRLRLSAEAAAKLASGPVDVVIRHGEAGPRQAVQRDGGCLYGLQYPWELHPGIVLSCNVEGGGAVVRIRTLPITPPVIAADGKSFDYQTNIPTYEREMRLTQLTREHRQAAPSIRDLCNRAFRLCGRQRPDGARAMTFADLATAVLGPAWRSPDARPLAATLEAMDLDRDGADYLWRPRVNARTRASDRSLLAAYGETKPRGRIDGSVRRHYVPMHLRHYTVYSPSGHKRETYADARAKHGMHGVLPEQLPPGYSWVKPYDWGADDDPDPGIELQSPAVQDEIPGEADQAAPNDPAHT